VNFGIMKL